MDVGVFLEVGAFSAFIASSVKRTIPSPDHGPHAQLAIFYSPSSRAHPAIAHETPDFIRLEGHWTKPSAA
jgi:hypothetical protein